MCEADSLRERMDLHEKSDFRRAPRNGPLIIYLLFLRRD